jgi:hypothetical protein
MASSFASSVRRQRPILEVRGAGANRRTTVARARARRAAEERGRDARRAPWPGFCEWTPGPRSAPPHACVAPPSGSVVQLITALAFGQARRGAARRARARARAPRDFAAAAELFYGLIKQNTFGRFVRRTRYIEEMLCDRTRIAIRAARNSARRAAPLVDLNSFRQSRWRIVTSAWITNVSLRAEERVVI